LGRPPEVAKEELEQGRKKENRMEHKKKEREDR
jgi:hypothetical protein